MATTSGSVRRDAGRSAGTGGSDRIGPPLEGFLVVSAEQALAAPLATCRLAEAGARVIKIERPEGDSARGYDAAALGQSSYFAWTNRGKESLVLDYARPDDAALLHRLLARADVFVQNIKPGALARAGFGSEELRARHPHLVTCDITGYGDSGPSRDLKAYDLLVQCESGLVSLSGAPEGLGRIGVSICDIGAGMNATIGIYSALMQRARTGRGCGVSVSLFDGAADWMTVPYVHELYGGGAPGRVGLKHPSIAPYGAFGTSDGRTVVVAIQNEREWVRFCRVVLGDETLAGDPRFASNVARVRHRDDLDTLIAGRLTGLTLAEAQALLAEADTAYAQVRDVAGFARHPALRTWPMPSPQGTLQMIAPPVRTAWDAGHFAPAPSVDDRGEAIRREFAAESARDADAPGWEETSSAA